MQHLLYPTQLDLKTAQLRALLEGANLSVPQVQIHAAAPLAYRNRIRLTLATYNSEFRAGYIGSSVDDDRGNDQPNDAVRDANFVAIAQCPIAAPILWHAAEALLTELNQRVSVWFERAPFTADQLELFTTADESQLQLSLFVRTKAKSLPARFTTELASLCEALHERIPALSGAGIYLLPPRSARSRRAEQPRPGPAWGSPGLNYTVETPEPLSFWVPRGAFFQVNRFLLPELVTTVTAGRSGELAWDLYAGVGLFTKALAPLFARVTAVEIAEPSFTALASAKLPNRRAVKDTTLDFLESAILQRDRPDLVVLDPPRTGAGREVCELLGRIAPSTLVYVSCSPQALADDLATLASAGYRSSELHLFDLFPQTSHLETVAVLTR